jgi:uncharacterized membrane protein YoaK (UPF0700 family)
VLIFLMVMASLMASTDCTDIINSILDILAGLFVMFLNNASVTEALLNWKPVSTGNLVNFSHEVLRTLVHRRVCKWQPAISKQASNPPNNFWMIDGVLTKW